MSDETTIQNLNPYDLVDHVDEKLEDTNPKENAPEQFLKRIIKAIAKKLWLPDPETWKPFEDNSTKWTNTTNWDSVLEQDAYTQKGENIEWEKKNFNFENVMSGVTWAIDKIKKKVEETWLKKTKDDKESIWISQWQTETEQEIEKNNEDYLNK